ncbi:MAG TPA: formylmethanofuran dehydrogenase subunit C [Methylophilaceae bacterium]|nr:formylmethanofuran dehydrogenase subunit C [Methylophilaceae bacterium]HAJ70849.1 formylmethanofuran dehydrogenase subunit C [Methylophilaceae bacterium]
MNVLTFTLKSAIQHAVDCRLLTPNALHGKTVGQIQALMLTKTQKVADFFDVVGEDVTHLVFKNTHAQLSNIGHQMSQGTITIEGDCGDFLGSQMQGGTIICKGNAGERLGDSMRRGTILVEGNVGEYCASSMKAGTIGVLGKTGARLGYGMKRGTLLLAHTPIDQATWIDCGIHSLPFLKLLFKSFALLDTQFSQINSIRVQRWMGDVSGLGKAEILVLSP